jgi:CheY-like chemotaxis protein
MIPPAQALAGISLLLVDDDEEVRDIFAEELSFLGARVTSASQREEALTMLRGGLVVDVVVSDFRMPQGDGLSLLQKMREEFASDAPLFILMTGFSELTPETALAQGVAGVFEKPIDWQALTKFLQQNIPRKPIS